MTVSAEIHNTGNKASDDQQDLDHAVCCSAGPLMSRNTPREADAAAAADDDEDIWGDCYNAGCCGGDASQTRMFFCCTSMGVCWS